jgi:hypothetical protein
LQLTEAKAFTLSQGTSIVASLLMTPLVVFLSSSIALYLSNQGDLAYQTRLLIPFFAAAGVVLSFGIAVNWLSHRFSFDTKILWA